MMILYAVRNKEGNWFRAKGYGGTGNTWVEDFQKARIYSRIGPARSIISFFANSYPQFGVPDLVALHITQVEVLDEKHRIKKVKEAKEKSSARHNAYMRELDLKDAREKLEIAKKRLEELS